MVKNLSYNKRSRLLRMLAEKKKPTVIAKKLRINLSTVYIHKQNNFLTLCQPPKLPSGRPKDLSEKDVNKIKKSAKKNPKKD